MERVDEILSKAEWQELAEMLEARVDIQLDRAIGSITAVLCHPQTVHPGAWLTCVLGSDPEQFGDEAVVQRAIDLVMRVYSQLSEELSKQRVRFAKAGDDDALLEWCRGFFIGATLAPWDGFEEQMIPIGDGLAGKPDGRAIEKCVLEAYMAEQQPAPAQRSTKVGRNDPCPCGSGRKFKKCCRE